LNRPVYISVLHIFGVELSIASFLTLLIYEIRNPGILFCPAVAILIALEVPIPKENLSKEALGSIKKGGVRRGIFIKELFTIALFWLTIATYLFFHDVTGTVANGILTIALIISDVANEIEAHKAR